MCVYECKEKKESGNRQRLTPAPQPDPVPECMMHGTIYDEKEGGADAAIMLEFLDDVSPKALHSVSQARRS